MNFMCSSGGASFGHGGCEAAGGRGVLSGSCCQPSVRCRTMVLVSCYGGPHCAAPCQDVRMMESRPGQQGHGEDEGDADEEDQEEEVLVSGHSFQSTDVGEEMVID